MASQDPALHLDLSLFDRLIPSDHPLTVSNSSSAAVCITAGLITGNHSNSEFLRPPFNLTDNNNPSASCSQSNQNHHDNVNHSFLSSSPGYNLPAPYSFPSSFVFSLPLQVSADSNSGNIEENPAE
jgi:hypothetical protein